MHAILLQNSALCLSGLSPSLRKSAFYHNEIADVSLFCSSRGDVIQSPVLTIRSEINRKGRPPRRKPVQDGAGKDDEKKTAPQPSGGESFDPSNQEETMALFRRIQSSISKGPISTRKRSSNRAKEKQPVETVIEGLNQYPTRKQVKGKDLSQGTEKVLPRRRVSPKKEPKVEDDLPESNFILSRPASNFMKRSPIPLLSTAEVSPPPPVVERGMELQRVDKMKLPELKELAKSKGVKGYSKLKKGELVELLKGLLQS